MVENGELCAFPAINAPGFVPGMAGKVALRSGTRRAEIGVMSGGTGRVVLAAEGEGRVEVPGGAGGEVGVD